MRLLLALWLLAAIGCRSAAELTHKGLAKDARVVRDIVRGIYPCTEVAKDTTVKTDTLYDIIAVECPPEVPGRIDTLEISEVQQLPGKTYKVYIRSPRIRETVTHTIRIKDVTHEADNTDCRADVTRVRKWSRAGWWTAGILGLIAALLVFMQIKRK